MELFPNDGIFQRWDFGKSKLQINCPRGEYEGQMSCVSLSVLNQMTKTKDWNIQLWTIQYRQEIRFEERCTVRLNPKMFISFSDRSSSVMLFNKKMQNHFPNHFYDIIRAA